MKIHGTAQGGAESKKDFGVAFSGNGGTDIDDSGLKAYWKFNEASGDILNSSESDDSLGATADLTVTGASYQQGSPPVGNGMLFDGVNDSAVDGGDLSSYNFMHNTSAEFTLCYWLKNGATNQTDYLIGNSRYYGAGTDIGNSFRYQATEAIDASIERGVDDAVVLRARPTDNYIPDTENWYFYVWTYDQSLSSDNMVITRNNANSESFTKTANAPTDSNSTFAWRVAVGQDDLKFGHFYISECSLWNRVLTDDEITALYNDGSGQAIY